MPYENLEHCQLLCLCLRVKSRDSMLRLYSRGRDPYMDMGRRDLYPRDLHPRDVHPRDLHPRERGLDPFAGGPLPSHMEPAREPVVRKPPVDCEIICLSRKGPLRYCRLTNLPVMCCYFMGRDVSACISVCVCSVKVATCL